MKPPIDYTLYLVTDQSLALGRPVVAVVEQAVVGGVTVVQLREKKASTRVFLDTAREVKAILDKHDIPLIVNDRIDIALACGASGVHVGQDDMPCGLARQVVGDDMIVGVSVSTVDEAKEAEAAGADYLSVSPVFETPTKTDTPPSVGLTGVAALRGITALPLVGIGGLSAKNAADVINAGADGIAVVSAIMSAPNPCEAARTLRKAISMAQLRP